MKGHTFSSMKLRQPSRGTKAVIFLPFLINWQRMALRIAELGCLDSTPLENKNRNIVDCGGGGERDLEQQIHLFSDNTLSHSSTTEDVSLNGGSRVGFVVVLL